MPKLNLTLSNGRSLKTITGVLAPVSLSSVATTSGSNIVTVASTTGVFPGMSVRAPNVPAGSIVNAVISATQLELWRSAWNASTGVYSHSAANAQATGTASGGTGHALGYDPVALVMGFYIDGTWRNVHSKSSKLMSYGVLSGGINLTGGVDPGGGMYMMPSTVTVTNGLAAMSAATIVKSDDLDATPLKRHDAVPHTCLIVVHTGGMLSVIHEPHLKDITYNGAD